MASTTPISTDNNTNSTTTSILTTTGADADYITVVEVDDLTSSTKDTNHLKKLVKRQSSIAEDSSFITVLTINEQQQLLQQQKDESQEQKDDAEGELVVVYRLPGERLGFGLKFQGGTRNTELVQKLYIQSCAADSPASKVATSWGTLREGDEIVSIDDQAVCQMTRIECVRCLKDNVAIKLIVRNGHGQKPPSSPEEEQAEVSLNAQPPPPPPVPPRKLVKRQNSKEQPSPVQLIIEKPLTPPPDAEYYINLFAESIKAGSESDDTASTISTVIDKFSMSSNYSSDTDLASSLNGHELAKVLKPFTLLEQEFQLEQPLGKPKLLIPGNNYENVEFKTEKINVYENVELKSPMGTPTPKPRIQLATVEPKKRSIIPMPRKIATPSKLPIEVAPPTVPTEASPATPNTNELNTNPTKSVAPPQMDHSTDTSMVISVESPKTPTNEHKEFNTKIPKAVASPSTLQRFLSRAKTESEIKLQQPLKQPSPQTKSRIPVVSPPAATKSPLVVVGSNKSPPPSSNIPRLLQKQKSETDLKLGLYRSKSKESSPSQLRPPLQRTNSAEAPARTPDRTYIPVLLNGGCRSSSNSMESLSSNCSNSSGSTVNGRSPKGPKPKPPERVQSLQKTQIPKLQQLPTTPPQQLPKPSMQTFKQVSSNTTTPETPKTTPVSTPSPTSNREIRFKIQTYESKTQDEDKLPSLFDLVHKQEQQDVPVKVPAQRDISALLAAAAAEAVDLSCESPPPLVVGKCMKVLDDTQETTCYSSSSSDEDDGTHDEVDDAERDYVCEDGEKLGPPELINGPGPSEAYFNMYWHSNMLPTIGEVEEELSSLEPQSLSNGPIVIVDDLCQQAAESTPTATTAKKLPQYVQPPKVPVPSKMEASEELPHEVAAKENANNDKIELYDVDKRHEAADHTVVTESSSSSTSTSQQVEKITSSSSQTENSSSSSSSNVRETSSSAQAVSETLTTSGVSHRITTTKVTTTKTSSSSSSSHSSSSSSSNFSFPDVAFKLQPYEEREEMPNSSTPTIKQTVHEERRVISEQKTLSELRTTDTETGEQQLLTSAESKSSSARFKKISSNDNLLDLDEQLAPLTGTVSAETRLMERLDNPQDKQSIETGILKLSECGKQLERSKNGDISYTECEQIEQQSYLEGQQILNDEAVDPTAEPLLQRELSETLIVSKDGEKQVTKRIEQSKEAPGKKGAKLLKKTEEERRLEQEAQKLIESYQKVKKEAEKLYNLELSPNATDEPQGFDLSAFEQVEEQTSEHATPVDDELGYLLHKHIIDGPEPKISEVTPTLAPKSKPPVPRNKPKLPVVIGKPKTAPPPVPQKRSEVPSKPTPTTRRSSFELTSPPKPLERIIVGVEQDAQDAQDASTIPPIASNPIITLASVDLPNVAATVTEPDLVAHAEDLLHDELHFESHQLPNVVGQPHKQKQQHPEGGEGSILSTSSSIDSVTSTTSSTADTTPITTPILVSATSSLDSVKSVIEVINRHDNDRSENSNNNIVSSCNSSSSSSSSSIDSVNATATELVEDVSTLLLDREHETGEWHIL
ncbi:titin-like [Scaptodrosophila lebanonensis]|uniref:Titin-like n=1 Tax=Drosophila lebanonensis TaxID=7225 RepID=A0A6J2UBQ5_DROLE|nr:titin-like [Scaptodrosophila lebanonensis]